MIKINVSEGNAKKLVEELIGKISEMGLYTMQKNDLNDYLLFLLDKYSEEHFLEKFSNFDNAKMFKVSEAKLKNSKLNIDLKFREGNDYLTEIKKFLANLNADNFRLNHSGDAYIFVLDNKYTRMCIENVLKKSGNTLNYSFNPERVEMNKDVLHSFLEEFKKELGDRVKIEEAKDSLIDLLVSLTDKILPIKDVITPIKTFIKAIKN
jgi:hypothetical protein